MRSMDGSFSNHDGSCLRYHFLQQKFETELLLFFVATAGRTNSDAIERHSPIYCDTMTRGQRTGVDTAEGTAIVFFYSVRKILRHYQNRCRQHQHECLCCDPCRHNYSVTRYLLFFRANVVVMTVKNAVVPK